MLTLNHLLLFSPLRSGLDFTTELGAFFLLRTSLPSRHLLGAPHPPSRVAPPGLAGCHAPGIALLQAVFSWGSALWLQILLGVAGVLHSGWKLLLGLAPGILDFCHLWVLRSSGFFWGVWSLLIPSGRSRSDPVPPLDPLTH